MHDAGQNPFIVLHIPVGMLDVVRRIAAALLLILRLQRSRQCSVVDQRRPQE